MKQAVIIIPTFNERENIQKIIPILIDLSKKITHWKLSILVVDDTSPDKTYEVVAALAEKHSQVRLLQNKQKSGLGGAYLKGMKYAFEELKADAVFEFDADLSHDPSKIPAFLDALDGGADLVLGSRYISGGGIPEDWGFHRKFLSIVGNAVIMTVLTNFSIRDWTTGYRALTREVYESVHPHLKGKRFSGYAFQIGFLYTAVKLGFSVVEVPFKFIDRSIGESKLGPEYIKNTLLFIIKVRLQDLLEWRLFKFAVVGGVGALVQLSSLYVYRLLLPDFSYGLLSNYLTAMFLSIETAVISNFILNNFWTFGEQTLKAAAIPKKFIAFNMASGGSIGLQMLIAAIGKFTIGLITLFTVPVFSIVVDTGMIYAMLGIIIGMFWNFFAYTKFIWNKKPAAEQVL
jgi:dolichol-phosphate mannosyltransferase